uniref:Cytochrome P450 n=1 Tax=Photinus pyralis TaxID=7054 RepID=A0A1Y1KCH3_PHOPY
MATIFNCACADFLAVVIACVIGLITFFKWRFKYWERKGLPYIRPSFPFGTMQNPLRPKANFGLTIKGQYAESKQKGLRHVGLFTFTKPTYLAIDLEYVRNVLSSDFEHFVDRGVYSNEKDDPLSANLAALRGAKWKKLRAKLTPTFTSGKMKMMFPLLVECGRQMVEAMCTEEPIDIKDWLGRFGTDVIGSCAFGIDCNSFKEPNSEFRVTGKRAFMWTKWESARNFLAFSNPNLALKLGIRTIPAEVSNVFQKLVREAVEMREKSGVKRGDFLQVLLDLKNSTDEEEQPHLSITEMTAQAFLFFVAGFETSSSTLSFCLFELAQHQDMQEKVREEIESVLGTHNELTYEAIKELKYMRQVIDETLRKYPPLPHLVRRCVKDYKVPGTNLTIEKGTAVTVSVYGIHYDPDYYPNPEQFDPERFSAENKPTIKPFTYLPFGEGPRMCIGLRFGLMQVAVGLALLLKNFRFTLSEKTKVPLKYNANSIILSVVGDIWLKVHKIQ